MALFGQDQPDPNALQIGAVLGDLLTGGSKARTQGAYVDQYKKNSDAADAMWGARDSRARAVAREGLTGDAMRALMTGGDGQFNTMASILAAGATPSMTSLGDHQTPDYARRVLDREGAFLEGDTQLANMLGAVNSGKDYKPVEVNAQGIAYDPNLPLGSTTFKTTPLADSSMSVDRAQIGNYNASAYANTQQGNKYGADIVRDNADQLGKTAKHLSGVAADNALAYNRLIGKSDKLDFAADADEAEALFPGAKVTSTYRSPAHNREVKGVPNSQHVAGTAFDIVPNGSKQVAEITEHYSKQGYQVINEMNRPGYGAHLHVQKPRGATAGTTLVPGGANPVKAGVQPNTDNGVGKPTVLGTTTPGRSVNAHSVTDFLAPAPANAYRGPLMASNEPAPGEIRKGYRFKGGNWRDKKNWTKVE